MINKMKRGISLIVLVITIIVMIILAGVVVMGLVETDKPLITLADYKLQMFSHIIKK